MTYIPPITNTTSTGNSSTGIIIAGQSYTGTWENVEKYNSIIIAPKTDQNGNYSVQFSPDSVNIDSSLTRYYRTGQIEPPHRFTITRKYARVVFENTSASAQTYFRLQTSFGEKENLNIPQDAIMSQDYDAMATRPTDFNYEVGLGRRQGVEIWNKFGEDNDLDSGDGEITIWSAGETLSPLTSAETFDITYNNTTDGSGTTGALELTFYYLDSDRKQRIATHSLGNDGSDTTSFSGLGINRVAVTSAGSALTNTSAITISATTAGSIQAYLPALAGITEQCFFFVQSGHKFLAHWLKYNVNKLSGGGTPRVTIRGYVRNFTNGTRQRIFKTTIDSSTENTIQLTPPQPFPIPESSLLEFTASTTVDNTIINLRFSGVEFRNVDA